MKTFKKINLNPVMTFIILILFTIVISGFLNFIGFEATYNKINIETGEYTIKSETDATELQDVCPVVCATVDPEMNKTYSSYCGNRYESLNYFIFKRGGDTGYDPSSQEFAINEYLKQVNRNYSDDSVVSIFMAPRKLVDWKIGNTTPATTWQSFPTSQAITDCYYKSALDVFTYQNQIFP